MINQLIIFWVVAASNPAVGDGDCQPIRYDMCMCSFGSARLMSSQNLKLQKRPALPHPDCCSPKWAIPAALYVQRCPNMSGNHGAKKKHALILVLWFYSSYHLAPEWGPPWRKPSASTRSWERDVFIVFFGEPLLLSSLPSTSHSPIQTTYVVWDLFLTSVYYELLYQKFLN